MNTLAKCPLCGEAASVFYLDDTPVTFSHCGIQANSVELWNRYAAAMELARVTVWDCTESAREKAFVAYREAFK